MLCKCSSLIYPVQPKAPVAHGNTVKMEIFIFPQASQIKKKYDTLDIVIIKDLPTIICIP